MNETIPDISDAEWRVMDVVWQNGSDQEQAGVDPTLLNPITSQVIIQQLAETTDWTAGTIKTLLHRLVQKGVLDFQRKGKRYLYRAEFSRDECIDRAGSQLLHTIFKGRPLPMLTYLVETSRLSGIEVEKLREQLDEIIRELPPNKPRRVA